MTLSKTLLYIIVSTSMLPIISMEPSYNNGLVGPSIQARSTKQQLLVVASRTNAPQLPHQTLEESDNLKLVVTAISSAILLLLWEAADLNTQ